MPGTNYTTNLRLANPSLNDTGWGTTVSNGMIDLTDQAIAGQATADVTSADVTLTIVDGSAGVNSARNMFLRITGTPGVARAVIVPTNRKLYFVTNTCGQTVTVKVSGQTGVAVPDTASMVLRINAAGTDVVQAFSYAASMSIGSITLGSALPAPSGGTGQSSYAVGDLLYASSTTALSKLTVGAANAILTSSGTAPQWTTTLGIASGGTGQTTAATAFDALKQAATDTYTGVVELATDAEALTGTDTTRPITPAAMRAGFSATGSAPVFATRAWINFYGVPTSGTYSRTGTLVTVNMTAHGMSTGMVANLTFSAGTGGTATSGSYPITSTGVDSFTITDTVSGSISGSPSVTRNTYIRASGNVTSLTTNGTGVYTVNFATAMPDNYYAMSGAGYSGAGGYAVVQIEGNNVPATSSCRIATVTQQSGTPSGYNFDWVTVIFVR